MFQERRVIFPPKKGCVCQYLITGPVQSGSNIIFKDSCGISRVEPTDALNFLILLVFDFHIWPLISICSV